MPYTVEIEGNAIEVPDEVFEAAATAAGRSLFEVTEKNVPKGFVPRAEVSSAVERAKAEAKALFDGYRKPEELYEDEEFKKSYFGALGLTLDDNGLPKAKIDDAIRADLEKQFQSRHVAPLRSRYEDLEAKYTELNETIAKQRTAGYERDVLAQAAQPETRVDDRHLSNLIPSKTAPFVRNIVEEIQTDDDGKDFYLDGHGERVYAESRAALVKSLMTMLKARDTAGQYFVEVRQDSSKFDDSGKRSKNAVTRAAYNAMSFDEQHAFSVKGGTVYD